jgi:hypothetical protein
MTILYSNSRIKDKRYSSFGINFFSIIFLINMLITIIQSKELDNIKTCNSGSQQSSLPIPKIESTLNKINENSTVKSISFNNSTLIENNFININNTFFLKLKNRILQKSSCRDSNCQTCNNRNSCLICISGFYLNNSTCFACPKVCLICSSNQICSKCDLNKNYFLNLNKTCSKCKKKCKICKENGNCLLCEDGYYLSNKFSIANSTSDNNSTCQACYPNCKTCINGSFCLACNDYYLLEILENKCNYCLESNCNLCDKDGKCNECKTGFYQNEVSICIKCGIDNCKLCNSQGNCTSCESGFYLENGSLSCKKCLDFDKNCLICSGERLCNSCRDQAYLHYSDNNSISSRLCKRCYTGTYLKNGNSCGLCNDFGMCSECSKEGCNLCIANSSPGDYSNCFCEYGYISIGDACLSLLIIILPVGFVGIIIIIGSYYFLRMKKRKALNIIAAIANNYNIIYNANNIHNNPNNHINNDKNNININDNSNLNNHRNIRVALENRISKPLASKDQLHGNKCIFGDESPPFWEFDCGGYMCNPCSLMLVTNLTYDKKQLP